MSSPTQEEEQLCGICFTGLHPKENPRGELNSCAHLFCFHCISEWAGSTNVCPQCKRRFQRITCKQLVPKAQLEAEKAEEERAKAAKKKKGSKNAAKQALSEEEALLLGVDSAASGAAPSAASPTSPTEPTEWAEKITIKKIRKKNLPVDYGYDSDTTESEEEWEDGTVVRRRRDGEDPESRGTICCKMCGEGTNVAAMVMCDRRQCDFVAHFSCIGVPEDTTNYVCHICRGEPEPQRPVVPEEDEDDSNDNDAAPPRRPPPAARAASTASVLREATPGPRAPRPVLPATGAFAPPPAGPRRAASSMAAGSMPRGYSAAPVPVGGANAALVMNQGLQGFTAGGGLVPTHSQPPARVGSASPANDDNVPYWLRPSDHQAAAMEEMRKREQRAEEMKHERRQKEAAQHLQAMQQQQGGGGGGGARGPMVADLPAWAAQQQRAHQARGGGGPFQYTAPAATPAATGRGRGGGRGGAAAPGTTKPRPLQPLEDIEKEVFAKHFRNELNQEREKRRRPQHAAGGGIVLEQDLNSKEAQNEMASVARARAKDLTERYMVAVKELRHKEQERALKRKAAREQAALSKLRQMIASKRGVLEAAAARSTPSAAPANAAARVKQEGQPSVKKEPNGGSRVKREK